MRAVEIGFRSGALVSETEPAAYEWNVQHRSGRFQKKPEESLMLSGDQNMIEVNAVVHYRISKPDEFLFNLLDGETAVRTAVESAIHLTASTTSIDDVLTAGRRAVEAKVKARLQQRLDRYTDGVEVLEVKLLDVHPSLEVVDAFREVSGAFEEKNRVINVAEGYRNEQVAIARGNGQARLATAAGYALGRKNRADGDARRFTAREEAHRAAPGTNETRLYLETMEEILPGKKKVIVDSGRGRRHLLLIDDGIEITGPQLAPLAAPRPPSPFEERER